ncbi:ABC transporter ATP-binding protein [Methanospirillum stamsii]|uniref:Cobalamin import ATP-binding protein BtuD n=1 Tax=Methanospirillum stamsii TaxID=1277351 RepID=A0A2V2MVG0_9EURY|nr:ABC transporter ATP-binding protein [Methanospirillum stamsii]
MFLKVKDLVFSYSSTRILDEVSLELEGSEILGILGPNGAGKSTLIRCINKILNPQSGIITFNDTNINTMTRMEIAKNLGYVPQTSTNPFPATVFDTILMGRRPHCGWRNSPGDIKKTLEILELVGIKDLAMRDFTELSGGQQQKVVLARALAQETDALLLDEPTSNLDVRQQLETMEIVRSLVHKNGISSIMAIHDLNLAARYADRILLMKNGSIFDVGDPFSVLTPENIREVYGVEAVIKDEDGRPYIVPKCPVKNCNECCQ